MNIIKRIVVTSNKPNKLQNQIDYVFNSYRYINNTLIKLNNIPLIKTTQTFNFTKQHEKISYQLLNNISRTNIHHNVLPKTNRHN